MTSSSSQTRISASSGRMSRRDAYDALQAIQAVARTFPGHQQAQEISDRAYAMRALTDDRPAKADVLALQAAVNTMVADRLLSSATLPPQTSPAITVYLFGADTPQDTARAATVAAAELFTPAEDLRLVDATPVQTATYTGTRYTFRVRSPYDAA